MATESVKIDSKIVAKVRRQKKTSGINVGKFFELTASESFKGSDIVVPAGIVHIHFIEDKFSIQLPSNKLLEVLRNINQSI